MKVVVIGGGSVGLLMAARLRSGGIHTMLVTRGETQARQLLAEGIKLQKLDGSVLHLTIDSSPIQKKLPLADIYILAVKQPDLPAIYPLLAKLPTDALLIALQNGLSHVEPLQQVISPDRLFFAINSEGAMRLAPTFVQHTGQGLLRIGPWEATQTTSQLVQNFVQTAQTCGIPTVFVKQISEFAWRKLVANSIINPMTALFELRNGELLHSSDLLAMMRELFQEAAAIAAATGQHIDEQVWQELLTICRNTSQNYSSMLQDIRAGKSTEIEAINGYLVKLGQRHGLPTQWHRTVRDAILLKTGIRLLKGDKGHDSFG
ncbi:ketopantoate reductase family protein [Brevibacillus fulvus]|uniref:2-dehydropantoate 2-reductase n=1 Tax=Brevibacillus fulvus TaxID=1125967 RepID=A0A939BNM5_9BACL|nr:2-dehydropantoate 2-reductase [Brevibacillus fulvus]MBM7589305.1 2-dehydropantoate 2-reductase [Brevibacillus fulvus]